MKHLHIRLAYALAALRALHATGLSHGDLKYYSIRVEKSDPEKVYLTDFNHASLGGAEADLKALHNLVLVEDDNEYLEVICKSLDSGVMDYDFWIPLLRRLAVEGEVRGDKIKARLQEIREEADKDFELGLAQLEINLTPENAEETLKALNRMLESAYNGLEFEREIDQTMRQIRQVEERLDRIGKISECPFESTTPRA